MIEFPPVEADLLGLVDRTDQQSNANREELDFRERHFDVARDDEALVQNAVQDVDEARRSDVPFTEWRRHKLRILVRPQSLAWSRAVRAERYLSNGNATGFLAESGRRGTPTASKPDSGTCGP